MIPTQHDLFGLKDHLAYVIDAHTNHARGSDTTVRRFDKRSPYWLHPVWCATTILTETTLPEHIRFEGAIALLYHDILEDTTQVLPDRLSDHIVSYIREMTCTGGFQEERTTVWDASPEVRLYKLYDKVHNLLDGSWMSEHKRAEYASHVLALVRDVEGRYGTLNITLIARGVLSGGVSVASEKV